MACVLGHRPRPAWVLLILFYSSPRSGSRPPDEDRWSSSAPVSFPVLDVHQMDEASFQMCEKAT